MAVPQRHNGNGISGTFQAQAPLVSQSCQLYAAKRASSGETRHSRSPSQTQLRSHRCNVRRLKGARRVLNTSACWRVCSSMGLRGHSPFPRPPAMAPQVSHPIAICVSLGHNVLHHRRGQAQPGGVPQQLQHVACTQGTA